MKKLPRIVPPMAMCKSLHVTNVHTFVLIVCLACLVLLLTFTFLKPPYFFSVKSFISETGRRDAVRLIPQRSPLSGEGAAATHLAEQTAPTQTAPELPRKTTLDITSSAERKAARHTQTCVHPKLVVSDPAMLKYVKKPPIPTCTKEEWLEVRNGTVHFSSEALNKHKNFTCDYIPLKRESESKFSFEKPIRNIPDGFQMVSDFFKGVCSDGKGTNNSVVYSGVHYSEERSGRSRHADPLLSGFEGLSIAILGFDSMSRMSWLRRLKKTREYFHDVMNGIELKSHNIVGDGTTAVILPMLTGHFEWELPECRKNHKMATSLDKFPWIWRDFARVGYLTSWANADPYQAAFNWRMLGFNDPPTDFYPRPYYQAVRDPRKIAAGDCDEGQTTSRRWLNYFRDIFFMYPQQRKFLFHFITDFSHDDNNGIFKVDDDLVDVLRTLHQHRYLNHTVLILMGDHGARYPSFIRASLQGKMEERLPYFGFAFPPWFEKKYPQAIANLRTNTDRLSTPFDLYETFKDFIHFQGAGPGDVYKRGISLFKEIPTERSCQQAGVAVHWCACLDWRNISADDSGVQRAVRAAVDTLNNLTAPYRQDCALLALQAVGSASKLQPRRELLSFKSERLEDRQVDLSGNTKNTMTLYQLTVTTTPGGGQFEVTVTHHHEKDAFTVSEKEISRINRYNNDPACILKKNTQIRAYCYCNNNIKSKH